MNILITDVENNLGKYLNSYLSKNNNVFCFTKDTLYLSDKEKTFQTISSIKPDILIHTSSLDNLDICQEDESLAYTLNTIGSLNAAYPCSIFDIPIIYFSTSYVYDGEKDSPYYETEECSPVNIFGKTKLASEKLIGTLCKKYFILRTSWIFGGENCFIKNLLYNKKADIFMCTEEIGNPTYIGDIALAIEKIMKSDLYGIYNLAGNECISKHDWVKYILKEKNIDNILIALPNNVLNKGAPRPKNGALNTSLLKNCFDIELPSWKLSTDAYLKKGDSA